MTNIFVQIVFFLLVFLVLYFTPKVAKALKDMTTLFGLNGQDMIDGWLGFSTKFVILAWAVCILIHIAKTFF